MLVGSTLVFVVITGQWLQCWPATKTGTRTCLASFLISLQFHISIIVYSLHILVVDLRLEFGRVCSRRGRPPPHPARAGPGAGANLGASCQGRHNEEINLVKGRGAGANEKA